MIAAFIQARLGSTRLPQKVLMDIGGWTSVARVAAAAREIRGVEKVRVLWAEDFPEYPENDVLSRFYSGWLMTGGPDHIMRLTADCPLIDPQVCQLILDTYLKEGCDYASNIFPIRSFPDGMDCEVFNSDLLVRAHHEADREYDREHVTPWMQRNYQKIECVQLPIDWSHWRLTLDTEEDLKWLRQVVAYHGSI